MLRFDQEEADNPISKFTTYYQSNMEGTTCDTFFGQNSSITFKNLVDCKFQAKLLLLIIYLFLKLYSMLTACVIIRCVF